MSFKLPGQYSGFHHACFPKDKFKCTGDGCRSEPDSLPSNYYRCPACNTVAWFTSKITTFRSDDIQRACALRRFKGTDPLPVHREMQKVHKKFRERGGQIHVLSHAADLPRLVWKGDNVSFARYPDHLPPDALRGGARAREIAEARARDALTIADPYAWDDGNEADM